MSLLNKKKPKKVKPPKAPKAPKKVKTPKTFTTKKLPKLLKKTYTEKKLTKKLLKKIYIPDDKEYLKSLFTECGRTKKDVPLYSIAKDRVFEKKEFTRLKQLGKDINKQKGRVKLIPLLASLILTTGIVAGIVLFKNQFLKNTIINTIQNATEARCDIEELDLRLLDATFLLRGFQVADKNNPMKNIVSIDNITFDFNLLQLLKSRFIANDLSINGVLLNSDRTSSGALPASELKKIRQAKEKAAKKAEEAQKKKEKESAEKKEKSPLMKAFEEKSKSSLNIIQNSVTDIFAPYNPETLFTNYYGALHTPQVAEDVQKQVMEFIDKYSKMPAEFQKEFNNGQEIVNSIMNINLPELQTNPLKIKDTIRTLMDAYEFVIRLKSTAENTFLDVQSDVNTSMILAQDVQNAVTYDTGYTKSEITKITSFTIDDGKVFISGSLETIMFQLLGDYYPYAVKAIDYLNELKESRDARPAKQVTPKTPKRALGRTVTYKYDDAPSLWIKNVSGSGRYFDFRVQNVSNNMDKTTVPATGSVHLSLFNIDHSADVTVDTRKSSEKPLVNAAYKCANIPVSIPTSKFNNIPGVPGLDSSTAVLDFDLNVYQNDGFDMSGNVDFQQVKLTTTAFKPDFISNIYINILSQINEIQAGIKTGYTNSNGLLFNLNTNVDKIFMIALQSEVSRQLEILKQQMLKAIVDKINEITNGALGEINNLDDLKAKIDEYKGYISNLSNEIEKKRKEAENFLNNALNSVEAAIREAAEAALKELQQRTQAVLDEVSNEAMKKAQELERRALEQKAKLEATKAQIESTLAEIEAMQKAAEEEFRRRQEALQAETLRIKQETQEAALFMQKQFTDEVERQKQAVADEVERRKKEAEDAVTQLKQDTEAEMQRQAQAVADEVERRKKEAEDTALKLKQEAEAELQRQAQAVADELERQKKAAEEEALRAQQELEAELERQKKAAEEELERQRKAAEAEALRLKQEAEEAARKKAAEMEAAAKKKLEEEAKKKLKSLF